MKRADDQALLSECKQVLPNTDLSTSYGQLATSFKELYAKEYPPMHWNIDKLLPAGTMLLFGKPKKGKSYLTLMISISIAAGRPVFGRLTSGAKVLYLGLEDSERRMQRRGISCAHALNIDQSEFDENLYISTESKAIDAGLLDELAAWMTEHPDTGLIVLDMLKKIVGKSTGRDLYAEQAKVGDTLTRFCHAYPQLSIIVVHHSRKADSDDPFDLVSGTTGLSGSYDSLAAIADTEGGRVLHITGRDTESAEIPLLMNERGMYTLESADSEDMARRLMSSTRRRVFDAINSQIPMTRKEIIAGCKLDGNSVDKQLRKLKDEGLIQHTDYGAYKKTGKKFYESV
ncbi:AAA family ATPase [Thiolapillus sp.]